MKPRLAQVITRMVPGGASKVVREIVDGVHDRYKVDLLTGKEDYPQGLEENLPDPVNVLMVPSLRRDIEPFRDGKGLIELCKIFWNRDYDLIHTHTSKAGLLGRFAAGLTSRAPLIHTPHGLVYQSPEFISGVPESRPLLKFIRSIDQLASLRQDVLTALSDHEASRNVQLGLSTPENTRTIYNGVSGFDQLNGSGDSFRRRHGVSQDEVLLLSVGRLSPEKGYKLLVRVFAEIARERKNVKLLIAGSGPARADIIESMPQEYSERLILPGHLEDIQSAYGAADIFVSSARYEGFGLSILEAMRAGLPVVATEVGGVPEILDHGHSGLLIPQGEPDALEETLLELLHDPELRRSLSEGARNRSEDFTVDKMVEEYRNLYDDLLRTATNSSG